MGIASSDIVIRQLPAPPDLHAGFLFHSPAFHALKPKPQIHFGFWNKEVYQTGISFCLKDNTATSGERATFGSFSFVQLPSKEILWGCIRQMESSLFKRDIKQVVIKHWPSVFLIEDPIPEVLSDIGYNCVSKDTDQYLPINRAEFSDRIRYNELKKLKKCQRNGYQSMQLSTNWLGPVYRLIQASRKRKGYPVTMRFEEVQEAFNHLDNYLLFGAFDGDLLIAAAISIRIRSDILYNLYHADHEDYLTFSPTVLLLKSIYHYAQEIGVSILDLGISSDKGMLNQGLYRFKQNVGCMESPKLTFSKSL